jgi:hypothetical protein
MLILYEYDCLHVYVCLQQPYISMSVCVLKFLLKSVFLLVDFSYHVLKSKMIKPYVFNIKIMKISMLYSLQAISWKKEQHVGSQDSPRWFRWSNKRIEVAISLISFGILIFLLQINFLSTTIKLYHPSQWMAGVKHCTLVTDSRT